MEGVTVCHSFTATCQCGKKITETRENQKEFIASIKTMSKVKHLMHTLKACEQVSKEVDE